MSFSSLALQRAVVSLTAVFLISACAENGREAPLSDVETIDIPVADINNQTNQNINNPTLAIPATFQVADGDLLTLVWNDEFDGAALDPEVWFYESADGSQYGFGENGVTPGWGNNELQYYLPDNVQLVNGVLQITARREKADDYNFTSGRITTEDRFAFKYGRIEASIKFPSGQGLWPAFWLLSQDSPYGDWAATGEIDVVEAVNLDGTGGNELFSTLHFGGEASQGQNTSSETRFTPSFDVTDDFHTYALEWDEFEMRWYVDGTLTKVENAWFSSAAPYPAPFDQPFHVLFNLAVGGNFPGSPDGTTPFPATYEIDWVRVYSGEAPPVVPADPGTIPDVVLYASDPNETVDLVFGVDYMSLDPFGSGSAFDSQFAGDADFSPAFSVTTGNGYGAQVGQLGILGFVAGFATGYETLDFKAKGLNGDLIRVKFLDDGNYLDINLATSQYSTALGNGWYQVSVPIADFTGVATATGLLFETNNLAPGPFTFLLTDLGFSGTAGGGGGADPGTIPDAVMYATDPGVTVDLPPAGIDNFGSGAAFDGAFAGDADFNPAFQVTSGEGYGAGVHVGFVAFTGYTAGFASGYDTFDFKAKVNAPGSAAAFEVKFIGGGDTTVTYDLTTYSGSTDLGNGWYQVSVPVTDFAANIAANDGLLLGPLGGQAGAFTMLLTDIGFSGTSGGADPGTIPDAVVYATDPGVTVDLPPAGIDNFGSGAAFDGAFAGDADFNPAFQVTSGEGYGAGVHVGFVAFTGYTAGFASGYETFDFKAKVNAPGSAAAFEVKFIGGGDTTVTYDLTTYSGSTDLGNGWYQVSVPMTDFAANIAANDGFLLGPLGGQAGAFTMLLTDIGFSGTVGGGAGTVPEAVVYATDPGVTVDLPPAGIDNFGSGAAFDSAFAGDADYNPAFQIASGEGYGAGVHVGFVAFTGYTAGFASTYGTFDFKAKVNSPGSAVAFEVKFIGGGDTSVIYDLTTYSGSTDLGNGWYQVSVPMADFATNIAANDGFLLGPLGGQTGAFTMLLTDIGFSGTAGSGGGSCAVTGGQYAVNGDFELGNLSCIETFPNGGTISADNTENNGGAWSAHVVAGPGNNPVVKFERRAVGTVMGSDIIDISFDMKGTAADGGVIFPEFISEGTGGAVVSNLLETIAAPTAGWTTYTYSPTAAADVSGGITFQIAVVCGGAATCVADVFIDNISMQIR